MFPCVTQRSPHLLYVRWSKAYVMPDAIPSRETSVWILGVAAQSSAGGGELDGRRGASLSHYELCRKTIKPSNIWICFSDSLRCQQQTLLHRHNRRIVAISASYRLEHQVPELESLSKPGIWENIAELNAAKLPALF